MADFKRILAVLLLFGIVGGVGYVYYFYIMPPGVTEGPSAPTTTTAAPRETIPAVSATPTSAPPSEEEQFLQDLVQEKSSACYICHDRQNTKDIHTVQTIVQIDDRKDVRRKTCVDCHGPRGPPWSATEQMTDPADITIDNATGEYLIDIDVPHMVHKERMLSGRMECWDCHAPNLETFEIILPTTDLSRGQVMYCENCKIPKDPHPDDGNYVTTHIDKFGRKCAVCHPGGVEQIHKLGR